MSATVAKPARKSTHRAFGQGILPAVPGYRLDCTIADLAWWELEAQREQDREIDRMYEEFRAQERLDAGLDGW